MAGENAREGVLNWLGKASFVVAVFNDGLYNSYLRITELEVIFTLDLFHHSDSGLDLCFTISVISHRTLSSAWINLFEICS